MSQAKCCKQVALVVNQFTAEVPRRGPAHDFKLSRRRISFQRKAVESCAMKMAGGILKGDEVIGGRRNFV